MNRDTHRTLIEDTNRMPLDWRDIYKEYSAVGCVWAPAEHERAQVSTSDAGWSANCAGIGDVTRTQWRIFSLYDQGAPVDANLARMPATHTMLMNLQSRMAGV
jgi:hypothetical protein